MLWPERAETAARNNLVQLLRRMRGAYGEDLVVGQETLALAPQVQVDVWDVLNGGSAAELPGAPFLEESSLTATSTWRTGWSCNVTGLTHGDRG
ncbi:hypothetical protein ACFSC4_26970 [Deinococcus malanensis]|uniref:hypothetical protein n=1 Tax=Deinococcus malanensis TaxID=1706855 RepID=UPI003644220D